MAAGGELQNLISEMRNSVSGLEVSQVKSAVSPHRAAAAPTSEVRGTTRYVGTWPQPQHNTASSFSLNLIIYIFLSFRSINSNVKCHTPRYKISYDADYYLQVLFGVELIFP